MIPSLYVTFVDFSFSGSDMITILLTQSVNAKGLFTGIKFLYHILSTIPWSVLSTIYDTLSTGSFLDCQFLYPEGVIGSHHAQE
jgi:hypothetical protein